MDKYSQELVRIKTSRNENGDMETTVSFEPSIEGAKKGYKTGKEIGGEVGGIIGGIVGLIFGSDE